MAAERSIRLTMKKGPMPGKSFELDQDVLTLGRDVSADMVVNDGEVSRHHARFIRQPGGYAVEDLGSTNGTFVNGMRVSGQRLLAHGDVVTLSETVEFEYETLPAGASATVVSQPTRRDADVTPFAHPPQVVAPGRYEEELEEQRGLGRYFAVGCGCLSVLACAVVAGALWYIDTNFLWCQFFPFLPGC